MPTYNGHPDYDFAAALDKLSPQVKAKAQTQAQNFEGMFLNSMFAQMTSGLKGEGPFGSTTGTGIWRSMQIEQYSKSFAQAGGVGIAKEVYRSLVIQQAKAGSQIQGKQA
jgi:flagellar protein FlgJ